MPRIKVASQEVGPYAAVDGRRASAADFGGGNGLDQLGDSMTKFAVVEQDQADRSNISDIQAKLAQGRAEWTVALQKRSQETALGDTTFAGKFDEDLQKYLEQARENLVTTKAGEQAFTRIAGEMRAHLFQSAGLYQAQSVGKKAVADFGTLVNANTSTVISDPTQADALLKQTEASLNDPNGAYKNVPMAEREALLKSAKAGIAYGAIRGTILAGAPELAQKMLSEDRFKDLDAAKKDDLIKEAQVAIKAKGQEAELKRLNDERARKEAQEATANKWLARIIDPKNNGGPLTNAEILKDTTVDSAHKQHWIDYKMRRAEELNKGGELRKNPVMVKKLWAEMIAGADDPNKVFSSANADAAFLRGDISTEENVWLRDRLAKLKDGSTNSLEKDVNRAVAKVERILGSSLTFVGREAEAVAASQRIANDIFSLIEEYKKAGSTKKPRDAIDPDNKDSPMNASKMQQYIDPPKDAMRRDANKARDAARAPAAGNTPSYKDYDKLKSGDQYLDPKGNLRTKS